MNKKKYIELVVEAIKQSKEDGNVKIELCGNCGHIMQVRHREGEKCKLAEHWEND